MNYKELAAGKALNRLEKMRGCLLLMQQHASEASALRGLWAEFVQASGTFYSTLEQGSKSVGGKAPPWFGKAKHQRKTDPLLKYLHFSRDAEEHGLTPITKIASSKVELLPGTTAVFKSDGNSWHAEAQSGGLKFPNDLIVMQRVHNTKWKASADPPSEFLGAPLGSCDPLNLAKAVLPYFEQLLTEFLAL